MAKDYFFNVRQLRAALVVADFGWAKSPNGQHFIFDLNTTSIYSKTDAASVAGIVSLAKDLSPEELVSFLESRTMLSDLDDLSENSVVFWQTANHAGTGPEWISLRDWLKSQGYQF